jgi:hypothetical protein
MIRLTDEGPWANREVVYEMIGAEHAHPKLLAAFGIPELYVSDRTVVLYPLNVGLPTALRSKRGTAEGSHLNSDATLIPRGRCEVVQWQNPVSYVGVPDQ